MRAPAVLALSAVLGLVVTQSARAETVLVAAAANFMVAAERLAPLFAAASGHEVRYSFGSTGQLHAHIVQGAPFEVFLAADDERPPQVVAEGLGVDGTVFTYAIGQLALVSAEPGDAEAMLAAGEVRNLAIADPQTAPYGRAALEALSALGLSALYEGRIVTGENVTQALQFVESGSAELGFVAASQVKGRTGAWIVPAGLYRPIRQDAVLLAEGEDNPAARAYLEFLRSDEAIAVIEAAGYLVE